MESGYIEPNLSNNQSIAGFSFSKRIKNDGLINPPIKRIIKPEKLEFYYNKLIRDYYNFIRSAETAFRLIPENFSTNEDKILYAIQYL